MNTVSVRIHILHKITIHSVVYTGVILISSLPWNKKKLKVHSVKFTHKQDSCEFDSENKQLVKPIQKHQFLHCMHKVTVQCTNLGICLTLSKIWVWPSICISSLHSVPKSMCVNQSMMHSPFSTSHLPMLRHLSSPSAALFR